ncbi:hypothetical protein AXF42_Ash002993 [Apostasia shenzhenica]|uniref:Uncharacterized protein n=1 Tax=Apostasia shenzhenica TaxID=1088818 RepID=A0A2I0A7W3_9ASPA|nr:hypothetical protein AXF42_Ash002993 [Apostasia shenzhenica]
MVGTQAMKRVPLIKFPQRHPKPSSGAAPSLFLSSDCCLCLFVQLVRSSDLIFSALILMNYGLLCFVAPFSGSGASSAAEQKDLFKLGSSSTQQAPASATAVPSYRYRSDVPAPPTNAALGGKASLLPKRTPLSSEEIEAILVSILT